MIKSKKEIPKNQTEQVKAPSTKLLTLLHQIVNINDIDLRKRFLTLVVTLTFQSPSTKTKISSIPLNCQQTVIWRILINGEEAEFTFIDPSLKVCYRDIKRRNLDFFWQSHRENVLNTDSDYNPQGGELQIKVPQKFVNLPPSSIYKVTIECRLEKPKGGVQFVIPGGDDVIEEDSVLPKGAHLFSYKAGNSSRLWFPCVDNMSEICTWDINIICPLNAVAISAGELIDQNLMVETQRKMFKFKVTIPTSAPNIGFVVGNFDIFPDPNLSNITYFHPPGLLQLIEHTVATIPPYIEFLELQLNCTFPHSMYKVVFVDESYSDVQSYASLSICSVDLLHPRNIIDQAFKTKRVFMLELATQYFACYLTPASWADQWLILGISYYMYGLMIKNFFGNNEYIYWIRQEMEEIFNYNGTPNPSHIPLYAELDMLPSISATKPNTISESNPGLLHLMQAKSKKLVFKPLLYSDYEVKLFQRRSHLVLRMLSFRIGKDILIKIFNKLLVLGGQESQLGDPSQWRNFTVATYSFVNHTLNATGKDISNFLKKWVYSCGQPKLNIKYGFNRRKHTLDIDINQQPPDSDLKAKFNGPLTILVQEVDTYYVHTLQIDEMISHHEVTLHCKLKRTKRKHTTNLQNGTEIEIDLSSSDLDIPVLWVKVDPHLLWLADINISQQDVMWQNMLKYDRDVLSQRDAIINLGNFDSHETVSILLNTFSETNMFYGIRILAVKTLVNMFNRRPQFEQWKELITCFNKVFGSKEYQQIIAPNNFSNFSNYFVQCEILQFIASLRDSQGRTPKELSNFLLDLLKFNENRKNPFSDGKYISYIIDALRASTSDPLMYYSDTEKMFSWENLNPNLKDIIKYVVYFLNLEKLLPSYKYSITCSCLKALKAFQCCFITPPNLDIFEPYTSLTQYKTIQIAAYKAVYDIITIQNDSEKFTLLLDQIDAHPVAKIKIDLLTYFTQHPPFNRKRSSTLDVQKLVERLWTTINTECSHDTLLRLAYAKFYYSLYGNLTPACLPQALGMVIDLKEKKARTNLPSTGTPISMIRHLKRPRTDINEGIEPSNKRKIISYKPPSVPMQINQEHFPSNSKPKLPNVNRPGRPRIILKGKGKIKEEKEKRKYKKKHRLHKLHNPALIHKFI